MATPRPVAPVVEPVKHENRGAVIMSIQEEVKPNLITKQGDIDKAKAKTLAEALGKELVERGQKDAESINNTLKKIVALLPKPARSATYSTTQSWATTMRDGLRTHLAQQTVANIISRCVKALNAGISYDEQYKLDNKAQVESRKRRSQIELEAEKEAKKKAAAEKEARIEQLYEDVKKGALPSDSGYEDAIITLSLTTDLDDSNPNKPKVLERKVITDSFLFISEMLNRTNPVYYQHLIAFIEGIIPQVEEHLTEAEEEAKATK